MSTIAEWLATLGMAEYAERFAKNGVDLSVVQELTDEGLKDLGVALGDRRKILRAISEIAGAALASRAPTTATERIPANAGERRQLADLTYRLVGRGMERRAGFRRSLRPQYSDQSPSTFARARS